jgi:uncharacterized membrane protein SirB2
MLARYYIALKSLHVAAVAISIGLFLIRGGLSLASSPRLQARFFRVVPHLVDTVLLASAVLLTLVLHQYPFVNGWLTAKLLALIAYVVLGSIAIRHGRTPAIRAVALLAALLVVGYIVATALHHDPDPLRW